MVGSSMEASAVEGFNPIANNLGPDRDQDLPNEYRKFPHFDITAVLCISISASTSIARAFKNSASHQNACITECAVSQNKILNILIGILLSVFTNGYRMHCQNLSES